MADEYACKYIDVFAHSHSVTALHSDPKPNQPPPAHSSITHLDVLDYDEVAGGVDDAGLLGVRIHVGGRAASGLRVRANISLCLTGYRKQREDH
jgi:hypothetical protein